MTSFSAPRKRDILSLPSPQLRPLSLFQDDKTSMCIRQERTQITNFWFKYQHPKYELLTVRLNPLTTFASLFIIIIFIIWCIVQPNGKCKCWVYTCNQIASVSNLYISLYPILSNKFLHRGWLTRLTNYYSHDSWSCCIHTFILFNLTPTCFFFRGGKFFRWHKAEYYPPFYMAVYRITRYSDYIHHLALLQQIWPHETR